MIKKLNYKETVRFRDQFRQARSAAFRDAEGFAEIIYVLERLGMFLLGKAAGLGAFTEPLAKLAANSPLALDTAKAHPEFHTEFARLFDLVRAARNDAMHQGAVARHLTTHAIRVALVLEDALMNGNDINDPNKIRDFMVHNPVCAELWQPVSFIRQVMLENGFSHLPFEDSSAPRGWKVLSERDVAIYLRSVNAGERKKRLVKSLADAIEDGLSLSCEVKICNGEDPVSAEAEKLTGAPILVLRKGTTDLIGILTSYDLL
jgi:CBS domain-containing protein